MKKAPVQTDNDYNVYCTGCYRHCYLYTLAREAAPVTEHLITDQEIIKLNIPAECPLPDVV